MKFVRCLISVLLLSVPAVAQKPSLRGQVTDDAGRVLQESGAHGVKLAMSANTIVVSG